MKTASMYEHFSPIFLSPVVDFTSLYNFSDGFYQISKGEVIYTYQIFFVKKYFVRMYTMYLCITQILENHRRECLPIISMMPEL